jgi:hypothetical protein
MKNSRNEELRAKEQALPSQDSKMHKFFNFFSKKEDLITLDQLWYRGLPNLARYCLWPIFIGNQLQIN